MKVFQIGFNKCASRSICDYMNRIDIPSIHWDSGSLACSIDRNVRRGVAPLMGYDNYSGFCDMEFLADDQYLPAHTLHFKALDDHYQSSKFILNTRNTKDWIKSRVAHPNYLRRFCQLYGMEPEDVISLWLAQWHEHHNEVIHHFRGRPDQLLVLDIDEPNIGDRISTFLGKPGHITFRHLNKSADRQPQILVS